MKYKEKLPETSCPPNESLEDSLSEVWRFIPEPTAKMEDFLSHNAKGHINRRNADECAFASCSLFNSIARVRELAKTQFFKKMHAAELNIPKNSGKYTVGSKGHIDFWMYDSFDPLSAIVQVLKP